MNPLSRIAWSRSDLILAQNEETLRWMPSRARSVAVVFPHTIIDDRLSAHTEARSADQPSPANGVSTAVFAGRLIPWKGTDLAVRAIARAPDWRLVICGQGPDEKRLRDTVTALGITDRVEFLGWQPRAHVSQILAQADAMLFPSLHDDAPFAVGEARAAGLPIICLNRGGPPLVAGPLAIGISANSPEEAVAGLGSALARVRAEGIGRRPDDGLSLDSTTARLRALLVEKGLIPVTTTDD